MAHYSIFETDGGFCGIAWTANGIIRFQLPTPEYDATERLLLRKLTHAVAGEPPAEIAATIADVKRYFAGDNIDFSSARLDLSGQDGFFRDIYDALRRVGYGQTTTYGDLAKAVGADVQAARSVGVAMARNPVALLIPCHRCLAAGGKIGGFSAPGGEFSKIRMLELEGVALTKPVTEPEQPSLF